MTATHKRLPQVILLPPNDVVTFLQLTVNSACSTNKRIRESFIEWRVVKSAEIIDFAQTDPVMNTRLPGVYDLMAAEAYHIQCCVQFERQSEQRESMSVADGVARDVCMNMLRGELITCL